jgi:hypothetical protein
MGMHVAEGADRCNLRTNHVTTPEFLSRSWHFNICSSNWVTKLCFGLGRQTDCAGFKTELDHIHTLIQSTKKRWDSDPRKIGHGGYQISRDL